MIRLFQVKCASENEIEAQILKKLRIRKEDLLQWHVHRKSVDARHQKVLFSYVVDCKVKNEKKLLKLKDVSLTPDETYHPVMSGEHTLSSRPVVVGFGPAGMFAALILAQYGYKPIVLERGSNVDVRKQKVETFWESGVLDEECNVQFGEGGAGAFSDGKLTTRSKDSLCRKVLEELVSFGAKSDILIDQHPHIGTDKLPRVIENMRNTIINCGGEVHFQTKMTRFILEGDRVIGVEAVNLVTGAEENYRGPVILATGHSARDVYRYLASSKIEIEAKGIAVGVRLEHPSQLIDQIQYHNKNGRGKYLPAAEYSFVTQVDGRGVYSFCMCPGGFVIPAATGPEQLVVNGMSPSNRGTAWSNSGMVVETHPEDVVQSEEELKDPLSMMYFQERVEKLCWQQANMKQTAPAQRMADFVNNRLSYDLPKSSYAPGIISSPLHFWMPSFISKRLQEGFKTFGKNAHGFLTNEATLIAMETRTSSPVRIVRDRETLMHVRIQGLFPCGEGAGYAGGIVSAGVDGERCAEMCAEYLKQQ